MAGVKKDSTWVESERSERKSGCYDYKGRICLSCTMWQLDRVPYGYDITAIASANTCTSFSFSWAILFDRLLVFLLGDTFDFTHTSAKRQSCPKRARSHPLPSGLHMSVHGTRWQLIIRRRFNICSKNRREHHGRNGHGSGSRGARGLSQNKCFGRGTWWCKAAILFSINGHPLKHLVLPQHHYRYCCYPND